MRHCILCNQLTNGAIGAAGMYWRNLCQTCKDSEDAALKLQIKADALNIRFILDKLFGLGEQGSGESASQAPVASRRQQESGETETLSSIEKLQQF